jgi:endonuclease YncB( thermonuclease family)
MKNVTRQRCLWSLCFLIVVCSGFSAWAEDAPAPRSMPRTPVSREAVLEPRDAMPITRQIQGLAAIIDSDKLRVDKTDIRLFGVVPPQLSASFGPQARAALDALANGQNVTCHIRDRDRDGRLLAVCDNASGSDMGLELLKRGLAVSARGSIAETDLATPYLTAEQNAQSERLGLWSSTLATPSIPTIASPTKSDSAVALPSKAKDDKVTPRGDSASAVEMKAADMQTKIAADVVSEQTREQMQLDEAVGTQSDRGGFFERYQILIAGFLMLATALSIVGAIAFQKHRDRREELKALAAALRGELMAARSVCLGRSKSIGDAEADRAATWPRLRSTLYTAYVGRLGLLGADLARQVAAVYGRASDYAALYNPTGVPVSDSPKKQALETLVKHIDEILPKLAAVERNGSLPLKTDILPQRVPSAPRFAAAPTTEPAEPTQQPAALSGEDRAPETAPQSQSSLFSSLAKPATLWDAVQDFIHHHAPASMRPTTPPEDTTDYAALIEADMARYPYGEDVQTLDISPLKKSG